MKESTDELFKTYNELLNSQSFVETDLDYAVLDRHIEMLNSLNVLDTSLISIFDLNKKKHIYLSSRFESVLGYNIKQAHEEGNEYFNKKFHPDDFMMALKTGNHFFKIGLGLDPEIRAQYKMISDYRILNGKGNYVRVIEQQHLLENDIHGNMWLALGVMDISPDQDLRTSYRSRMVDLKNGDLYELNQKELKPSLSNREQEVLKMISSGLRSKEIADKLFISVHTVNTHRQRIIEKLDVNNTFEALNYASALGIV